MTVVDGANAGTTATVSGSGEYQFPSLALGDTRFTARLTDWQDATGTVNVDGTRRLDFTMRRVFRFLFETLSGPIGPGDVACASEGTQNGRPCRRHPFEPTNAGALTAFLSWPGTSNLDLELWRGTQRLSTAALTSGTSETLSINVSGASDYQLRVVYTGGSAIENYTVTVSRPN